MSGAALYDEVVQTADAAVLVDSLVMKYGDKTAVDDLSLVVPRGTITSVLGPNGAGKTTTLETCEGYRRPHAGQVRVLGLDPWKQRSELLPRIGVMLQGGGAWSGVRADEMLRHVASLHASPLDVIALSERLGLDECGRTPFRRLSGGQQQRLGLAMAVVGRPEIVFVDEPTAGMDPQVRRRTWALLEELRASGVTVVLTTHYLEEAERLSDVVHIVDRGRVVVSGSPEEITGAGLAELRLEAGQEISPSSVEALTRLLGSEAELALSPDRSRLAGRVLPGTVTLGHVTDWCRANDVDAQHLSLGQRTLEDVYLELTSRLPEEQNA